MRTRFGEPVLECASEQLRPAAVALQIREMLAQVVEREVARARISAVGAQQAVASSTAASASERQTAVGLVDGLAGARRARRSRQRPAATTGRAEFASGARDLRRSRSPG